VAQQLGELNVANIVLERGTHPGWMWGRTYDSLCLHTGKHLSALPGMPYPKGTNLFPSRAEFMRYLSSYARQFNIALQTGTEAMALGSQAGSWTVETNAGFFAARTVVVATGIMSSPVLPIIDGMESFSGSILHSSEYRKPDGYAGKCVLVVGIGNSGAEIAAELANHGAEVAVSVRSGANVVPRSVAGVPSQYLGWAISWLPRRGQQSLARLLGLIGATMRGGSPIPRKRGFANCPDVPLIGLKLVNLVRSGSIALYPGVARFLHRGVEFTNGVNREFDSIILATGFRAAMDWMGEHAERDDCGFAKRRDRVRSLEYSNLYFVGHNYDGRGGLYNIGIDAKRIARLISASH
jgi:hypothetical protein